MLKYVKVFENKRGFFFCMCTVREVWLHPHPWASNMLNVSYFLVDISTAVCVHSGPEPVVKLGGGSRGSPLPHL